ncbi:DUF4376 domain-containing protein [Bibersteinia trehalosi]|uniref:DUF4376 domain-containing protein n=1 Tax=Bibersteinia trehalosi TaxID=47735 RepID=A0A3R8LCB3_BIBTR|nr:DUF4376 domain-containing protein [Bibersteinia trehalosi]RRN04694.1 DUF4376 domain-containing protein [Bibersteinia trehalosi]
MQYFYDLSQKTFLIQGIHNIPPSAIPVPEKDYQFLIDGRAKGREIVVMGNTLTLTTLKPSAYHVWSGTEWVISPEQQTVKKAEEIAKVREQINALRDRKINGGVYVEAVGKWIDTDATAERNILSVKASFDLFGDAVGEIAWTCADNSTLMIDKAKLMLIWQALMQAKTGNHANALQHKTAVEQSENPLEYDYSGGWSKTYQDFLVEQGNE